MHAAVMYGARDVRIDDVPDVGLIEPTDALVRVTHACICGSDLWPYKTMEQSDAGRRMGDEAIERVRELTDGHGVHSVLECVGLEQSELTAIEIARPGGAVGRVGVPQDETMPASQPAFYNNISVSGGPAPVRAYIEELLPDLLEGRIGPGRVFDRAIGLDEVPDGYRTMNDREAIKVMIKP